MERLADGTLPEAAFIHFLRQDFLYLTHYARLTALAAYKCEQIEDIAGNAEIILSIHTELEMHIRYCGNFGISRSDLINGTESVACTVYTRYIESIGNSRDWLSLQVALTACLVGYGEVGKRLYSDEKTDRTSKYWPWVLNYVSDEYASAVVKGRALLEKHIYEESPSKVLQLIEIFRRVTEYESLFWSDALKARDLI